MSGNIKINVVLSLEDFKKFNMYNLYGTKRGKINMGVGISALILFIAVLFITISRGIQISPMLFIILILPVYYLIYLPVSVIYKSKNVFESDKFLREKQHYLINNSGMNIKSESFDVDVTWDKVFMVCRNDGFIYIYLAQFKAFILPEKFIHDVDKLIGILTDNIDMKKLNLR